MVTDGKAEWLPNADRRTQEQVAPYDLYDGDDAADLGSMLQRCILSELSVAVGLT